MTVGNQTASAGAGKGLGTALAGPIGGLAMGAIGSIWQNASTKRAQKRAFKYSKKMFDYQNAYNTPANQMARLRSAGLNPALMYGQGTTGNASNYPQMPMGQFSGPRLILFYSKNLITKLQQ